MFIFCITKTLNNAIPSINRIIRRSRGRKRTMSHLSVPLTPSTTIPISGITKKITHLPSQRFHKIQASSQGSDQIAQGNHFQRRNIALGLGGVVVGLSIGGENAKAARREPPPPAEEKKDPNVSGLMAKVLASKKRKEAMKESMAKLREKGKAMQEPSQQPDSSAD